MKMNNSLLVLSKCYSLLGLPKPDMENNFNDRLQLQKIVYLLWADGISLGYGFNWYAHGPYSPRLAAEGYALNDEIFKNGSKIKFNNEKDIVVKLKDFREHLGNEINDHNYLEILASLHYIKTIVFDGRDDFNSISTWLINQKPHLADKEKYGAIIKSAYTSLKYFET